MKRSNVELRYVLLAIVLITIAYVLWALHVAAIPRSDSLGGHLIGVFGFILMLMTELLYSIRKRSKRVANWGSMESWLRFHIFTGVVGPYMVLLHASWRFNGLAGVVTLLTLLIVLSGFIGRYIYTAVPRTAEGVALISGDLQTLISASDAGLQSWLAANQEIARVLPPEITNLPELPYNTWPLVLGRVFIEWGYRWRRWRATRELNKAARAKLRELNALIDRRRALHYQLVALVSTRRALVLWHSIHLPLGIALFTLAFVHIGVAIYYVTLAK